MTALVGLLIAFLPATLSAADIVYDDGQEHVNVDILDYDDYQSNFNTDNIKISGEGTSLLNEGIINGQVGLNDGTLHNYGEIYRVEQQSGITENHSIGTPGNLGGYSVNIGSHDVSSIGIWYANTYGGDFNNYESGTIWNVYVYESSVFNNDGAVVHGGNSEGGVFNNNGVVGDFGNGGMFNNNNYVENISNSGTFNNNDHGIVGNAVVDGGVFNNNDHGIVENVAFYSSFSGEFNNNDYGTVVNAVVGSIGEFNNNDHGTVVNAVVDGGVFNNNYGTVNDADVHGLFYNGDYGTVMNATVGSNGEFYNSGSLEHVTVDRVGTVLNSGYVENATVFCTGELGRFYNNDDGTIGIVTVERDGVFNNNGTVGYAVTLSGSTFNNNGTVGSIDNVYGEFNNNGTVETSIVVGDGGVFNNNVAVKNLTVEKNGEFNNNGTVGHVRIEEGDIGASGGVFNNDGTIEGSVQNDGEFNNTGTINGKADIYRDGVMNNEATGRIEGGATLYSGELVHNGWIGGDVNVEGGQLSGEGRIDGTLRIASGGIVDTALFTGMINKLVLNEGGTLVFNLDPLNGDFSTLNFAGTEPEPAPFSIMSVFASSLPTASELMELNGTILINILNDDFVDVDTTYDSQSLFGNLLESLNIDPETPDFFSNWTVQSTNYLVSITNDGVINFEAKDGGEAEPPVTPEPATLLLFGLGLAGLPIIRNRMRRAA